MNELLWSSIYLGLVRGVKVRGGVVFPSILPYFSVLDPPTDPPETAPAREAESTLLSHSKPFRVVPWFIPL